MSRRSDGGKSTKMSFKKMLGTVWLSKTVSNHLKNDVRYPFAGKIYNLDTILDNLTSINFVSRAEVPFKLSAITRFRSSRVAWRELDRERK